jgi:hypothetical protein
MSPRANASRLTSLDFAVLGQLPVTQDSGTIHKLLGRPDSIIERPNPYDPGATFVSWFYRDYEVFYSIPDSVNAITLLTPRLSTHRGLRVGDTRERTLQLYGTPARDDGDALTYEDPSQPWPSIVVHLKGDQVASIFVGYLLD